MYNCQKIEQKQSFSRPIWREALLLVGGTSFGGRPEARALWAPSGIRPCTKRVNEQQKYLGGIRTLKLVLPFMTSMVNVRFLPDEDKKHICDATGANCEGISSYLCVLIYLFAKIF